MRGFAIALFLCLPSLAAATERPQYNPYTQRYEYAPKGATLQYNPYRKQRELVGPGETLQYNPYTKKREFAPEEPCRATIPTRSSESLLVLTSRPMRIRSSLRWFAARRAAFAQN